MKDARHVVHKISLRRYLQVVKKMRMKPTTIIKGIVIVFAVLLGATITGCALALATEPEHKGNSTGYDYTVCKVSVPLYAFLAIFFVIVLEGCRSEDNSATTSAAVQDI